jgi:hypothetical protein
VGAARYATPSLIGECRRPLASQARPANQRVAHPLEPATANEEVGKCSRGRLRSWPVHRSRPPECDLGEGLRRFSSSFAIGRNRPVSRRRAVAALCGRSQRPLDQNLTTLWSSARSRFRPGADGGLTKASSFSLRCAFPKITFASARRMIGHGRARDEVHEPWPQIPTRPYSCTRHVGGHSRTWRTSGSRDRSGALDRANRGRRLPGSPLGRDATHTRGVASRRGDRRARAPLHARG